MREYRFSKSNLLSACQCHKRLYLEIHHPDLAPREPAKPSLAFGSEPGSVARSLHPQGRLIGIPYDPEAALARTEQALADREKVLFEPAFRHCGVTVWADLLFRERSGHRLVEVKSATKLKDYYYRDASIQSWVLRGAGVKLKSVHVAHIDKQFVYAGDGAYRKLFTKVDVSAAVKPLTKDLPAWVKALRKMLAGPVPDIPMGPQCDDPFPCPFQEHCTGETHIPDYPVAVIFSKAKRVVSDLQGAGYDDLRKVPENLLKNEQHRRIWRATRSGKPWLDIAVKKIVGALGYPRYYLDFETVSLAVPVWKGARPYTQLPFQFSCHKESKAGSLEHLAFLHLTPDPPMESFAEALIAALGGKGPVLVYSGFERQVITALAGFVPRLAGRLKAIQGRLVDLCEITRKHYYHRDMMGHWSLKLVLPTIALEMDYGDLAIQEGGAAMNAYREAAHPDTSPNRRERIRHDLLEYCKRDTLALVRLAHFFRDAGKVHCKVVG